MATQTKLRSNLPAHVSSFIGREAELTGVRALVGGARLVTLTGAGGAGKARRGLQVAAGLAAVACLPGRARRIPFEARRHRATPQE